jgi:NADP-dependent 3-hydroxy acid dehydrogenase YdfG
MAPLVWLVTGCSSGLGEVFVQEALSRGDQVIATARGGTSRLQHLADAGAHTVDLDVTASQEELNTKVNEAAAKFGRIDVLINNAGYMAAGAIEEALYVLRTRHLLEEC